MRSRVTRGVLLLAMVALVAVGTRAAVRAAQARKPPVFKIISQPTLGDVRVRGGVGDFEVGATATVWHLEQPMDLVWFLRLREREGDEWKTVWEQRYEQQRFVVPQGETLKPTFQERLMMPPGRYQAQVGLMENRAGEWVTIVSDSKRVVVD